MYYIVIYTPIDWEGGGEGGVRPHAQDTVLVCNYVTNILYSTLPTSYVCMYVCMTIISCRYSTTIMLMCVGHDYACKGPLLWHRGERGVKLCSVLYIIIVIHRLEREGRRGIFCREHASLLCPPPCPPLIIVHMAPISF